MKLTYTQLEQQVMKQLGAIYLINGDEILLKNDAIQLIRKSAKLAGFTERLRITSDSGYDWGQLHLALHSQSLLAEKRLFELDFRGHAPNKNAGAVLQEYAEKPLEHNLLLIDISKLDEKITKSSWYRAIEKNGFVVTIWPIPREQLPSWIIQRAKKYKLQINYDAANLLADYIEGNLVAAAQAIEKIYLLQPQQPISTELIQSILTDESQYTIFDFIDKLIAGDIARTLHILETLKENGTEPTLILWGITRELRLMSELAQQLMHGATVDSLFQKHRVFTRRQPAVRLFLKKHTMEDCWDLLIHSVEIDKLIKGAMMGNVWDSLQLFCLRMG